LEENMLSGASLPATHSGFGRRQQSHPLRPTGASPQTRSPTAHSRDRLEFARVP
jgi:hypothetical protein